VFVPLPADAVQTPSRLAQIGGHVLRLFLAGLEVVVAAGEIDGQAVDVVSLGHVEHEVAKEGPDFGQA
jgi:hypothetical protein